ncbi:MAG: hypothetical protein RXQ94_09485 [Caldivirga sp.]
MHPKVQTIVKLLMGHESNRVIEQDLRLTLAEVIAILTMRP